MEFSLLEEARKDQQGRIYEPPGEAAVVVELVD